MTESEWMLSTEYSAMMNQADARLTRRKKILFGCGTARQVWHLTTRAINRHAIETAERYADGLATDEEYRRAWQELDWESAMYCEWHIVALTCSGNYRGPSDEEGGRLSRFPQRRPRDRIDREWSDLVREVIGNPFRPVAFDPRLRADRAVRQLAEVIYQEHRWQDLPILADALEDAGCTGAEVLQHCRQPGFHVRGCWAVDLILSHYR